MGTFLILCLETDPDCTDVIKYSLRQMIEKNHRLEYKSFWLGHSPQRKESLVPKCMQYKFGKLSCQVDWFSLSWLNAFTISPDATLSLCLTKLMLFFISNLTEKLQKNLGSLAAISICQVVFQKQFIDLGDWISLNFLTRSYF